MLHDSCQHRFWQVRALVLMLVLLSVLLRSCIVLMLS
jgi:hypothetical protein